MLDVARHLEGQLTATLHIESDDFPLAKRLLPILERKAGRILANGFPTGVEVSYAMVHGGPFPATSDSRATSVGAMAIERFLRPVCYQDLPAGLAAASAFRRQSAESVASARWGARGELEPAPSRKTRALRRPLSDQEKTVTVQERRYPDPAVRVLDPRFNALRLASASVECLYQGARWSEGPVWFGDGRYLLWSDIPNNRILRWDEATGAVGTFRQPSNNANGHTRDREGRLVTCEHLTRRVTRTEYDGSITVLADRYDGKPLNSPNDVIVKSDGSIWFSDPTFGIDGFYEGEQQEPELPPCVYRVDGQSGEVS